MPPDGPSDLSRFASSFPKRFGEAVADAQGAIAGITASGGSGGVIEAEALKKLHEIYRLRVELEIETAGILWRTAEVVCAMADTLDVLTRQRTAAADVEGRRLETGLRAAPAPERAEWTRFAGAPAEHAPAANGANGANGHGGWPPARTETVHQRGFGAEAA